METPERSLILFFLSFAVLAPVLHAHTTDFDSYWQHRAAKARAVALDSYLPDPTNVTNELNKEVNQEIDGGNSTRRNLKRVKDRKCMATNPIDRCWRCDPHWTHRRRRQRLAKCVLGFGRKAKGGKGGKIYIVTDPSDSDIMNPKKGTLRHAVIQKGKLWIVFAHSMIIRLNQELMMTSHKTIDARGANVHIAYGAGITLQFVSNVIIHGLHIHDIVVGSGGLIRDSVDHYGYRTRSDGDGISIFGSSNIWIDHVSMSRCTDGIIDIIMGSTGITISNSHFTHHNEVMLMGASNSHTEDSIMQVTIAFNHFGRGLVQRMPRCRFGFFHVVNNDYTHWEMYAIGGSNKPTIISQGNRFIAPDNGFAKEVTKRDYAMQSEWKNWNWRSEGDLMMNGAFFVQSGNPRASKGHSRFDMIKSKPGTFVRRLTRYAGALNCHAHYPC